MGQLPAQGRLRPVVPLGHAESSTWDAYLLRSATVYEEVCGHHTITQGGYYEYSDGANLGYRSWLHYILPMIYSDPELAREILEYAVGLQPPPPAAQNPYGMGPLCQRVDLGTSDDLDFWLLLAAGAYGLGTRDTKFFDTQIPYFDTQGQDKATIWEHLKVAFQHEQSMLGPHGGYLAGSTGDWNDFSTEFEQLTESMLVTAQNAYALPQLAELADLRGDPAFAAQLRAAGTQDLATMRAQWTGGGWYSRGYSGNTQVGKGVIFEEPQPWAILAGAPSPSQANTLVANIRRFLDGVGAPSSLGGPARFGTAQVPARADPGVTEKGPLPENGPTPDIFNQLLPNSPLAGRRRVAGWRLVRPQRLAHMGLREAGRRGPRRPRPGLERVRAQHAGQPRDAVARPLGWHDLDRRCLLRLLLEPSRLLRQRTRHEL